MSTDHDASRPILVTASARLLSLVIGLALVAVFGIAAKLNPDPRGFGTHQQLGLPACTFKSLTGMNCPQCGMTTSFAFLVRGEFLAAVRANPAGLILAPILLLLIPWCLLSSIRGRWLFEWHPQKWVLAVAVSFLVLCVLLWLMQVLRTIR